MGSGGLLGAFWTFPDTFWTMLEKLLPRTYFEPLDRSRMIPTLEPGFQIFQIWDPRKSVLGPGDVFACFSRSNILPICFPYGIFSINYLRCSTKVFPMNLPVNMALALFWKQFQINRNNCKMGIGEIRIFFHWIAYWIAYSFPLESLEPIHSAWIAYWPE